MMKTTTALLLSAVAGAFGFAQDAQPLNAKLSSAYVVSRFDKKLGTAGGQIDPYGGGVAVTHVVKFAGPDAADKKARIYNVQSRLSATLSSDWSVESLSYEYRFGDDVFSATYKPGSALVLAKNGEARTVDIRSKALLALTPEIGFLQLAQLKRLNESKHRLLLVLPTDREFVLREVTFRVVGPETRRYADQLMPVTHLTVDDPPEFFSLRDFYIDAYGRLVEWTALDHTRLALASETQFTRLAKPVESWYKAVRVVPHNQAERAIGFSRSVIDPASLSFASERSLKRVVLDVVGESTESWKANLTKHWQIESFSYRGPRITAEYQSHSRRLVYNGNQAVDVEAPFLGTLELAGLVLAQREELLASKIHRIAILDPDSLGVRNVTLVVRGPTRKDYFVPNVYVVHVLVAIGKDIVADLYLDKYGRALDIAEVDGLRTIVTA
jgi:hypothetical protein